MGRKQRNRIKTCIALLPNTNQCVMRNSSCITLYWLFTTQHFLFVANVIDIDT